ncbi:hypothetical protein [Longimicrobium sp.]|uniref:hypothetical protein n=1 Tax=Longimicrobium sp. TaxID=2029185 RepID=UPI002E377F62|nr:hypothetical protein [Longimicrobium sp.]HEX6037774.1 hypothetical protein [Longimicrobium sp.]
MGAHPKARLQDALETEAARVFVRPRAAMARFWAAVDSQGIVPALRALEYNPPGFGAIRRGCRFYYPGERSPDYYVNTLIHLAEQAYEIRGPRDGYLRVQRYGSVMEERLVLSERRLSRLIASSGAGPEVLPWLKGIVAASGPEAAAAGFAQRFPATQYSNPYQTVWRWARLYSAVADPAGTLAHAESSLREAFQEITTDAAAAEARWRARAVVVGPNQALHEVCCDSNLRFEDVAPTRLFRAVYRLGQAESLARHPMLPDPEVAAVAREVWKRRRSQRLSQLTRNAKSRAEDLSRLSQALRAGQQGLYEARNAARAALAQVVADPEAFIAAVERLPRAEQDRVCESLRADPAATMVGGVAVALKPARRPPVLARVVEAVRSRSPDVLWNPDPFTDARRLAPAGAAAMQHVLRSQSTLQATTIDACRRLGLAPDSAVAHVADALDRKAAALRMRATEMAAVRERLGLVLDDRAIGRAMLSLSPEQRSVLDRGHQAGVAYFVRQAETGRERPVARSAGAWSL